MLKTMHKLNKLNSKGFGHIVAIIAIAVAIVVVGAGVVVYNHQHKAHAAGFATITSSGSGSSRLAVAACKTYINAYGGIWRVTVVFSKPASASGSYTVTDVKKQGGGAVKAGSAWLGGTVGSLTIDTSAAQGDTVSAGLFVNGGGWNKYSGYTTINPAASWIPAC
jgi:hypothetical protein